MSDIEGDVVRELAMEQRRRLVASIMEHAERSPWWRQIERRDQEAFRAKVLDACGRYHDFVLDVLRAQNRTSIRSEDVKDLLERIWGAVRQPVAGREHV